MRAGSGALDAALGGLGALIAGRATGSGVGDVAGADVGAEEGGVAIDGAATTGGVSGGVRVGASAVALGRAAGAALTLGAGTVCDVDDAPRLSAGLSRFGAATVAVRSGARLGGALAARAGAGGVFAGAGLATPLALGAATVRAESLRVALAAGAAPPRDETPQTSAATATAPNAPPAHRSTQPRAPGFGS